MRYKFARDFVQDRPCCFLLQINTLLHCYRCVRLRDAVIDGARLEIDNLAYNRAHNGLRQLITTLVIAQLQQIAAWSLNPKRNKQEKNCNFF